MGKIRNAVILSGSLLLSLTFYAFLAGGCTSDSFELKAGDLLFQKWTSSDFAKAINAVTAGYGDNDFAHVGLVLSHNDSLQVLEAVTGAGVVLTPIEDFLNASVDANGIPQVAVGRLKQDYQSAIAPINDWMVNKLGAPYDTLFIYGNEKYYCSELIHDAFNLHVDGNDAFELQPMTFKDPKTKAFFPIWETYFEAVNAEIPEGALGINPGLMSRSKKLEIVKEYF